MSENAPDRRHPMLATDAEMAALDSLVTMVEESRKGRAAFEAMELQALAGLSALADQQRERLPGRRAVRELPLREIAAEVGFATRVSDRVMQGLITDAAQTVALFPSAVIALSEGRISRGHVTALLDAGASIDDVGAREAFAASALEVAERESVGRFRAVVRGMAERVNPRSMTERHRLAREDRGTRVRDLPDGMGEFLLVGPAVTVYGAQDRLTQQAKIVQNLARAEAAERSGEEGFVPDERTLAQVRADLAVDLLLTGAPAVDPTAAGDGPGELGAIRALVQITVPVLTAAGIDDDLVELDGRCPIDPDTARELLHDAPGWDRVLTHPITGAVLAVDRYTPSADLKRTKQAVDRRCRCPGCRMVAHRCDLDHNHAAAQGGATADCNLCHFCRRHHVLKHQPGWKVRQLQGGRIEWTTPTGRVYIDEPPPRAAYLPDPPPRREGKSVDIADFGRTTTGTPADLIRRFRTPGRGDGSADGGGDDSRRRADRSLADRSRTVAFLPDGDDPPF